MAKIEIILLESRTKLGVVGDIVKVNAGYARNFLLPQNKALRSTPSNRELFESKREQLILTSEKREDKAQLLKKGLEDMKVKISRQAGVSGHLYGSVSARDISEALTELGHPITHSAVQLSRPIKSVGSYNIILELSPKITHNLQVDVINSSHEDGDIPLHIGMKVYSEQQENEEKDSASETDVNNESSETEKPEEYAGKEESDKRSSVIKNKDEAETDNSASNTTEDKDN